MSYVLFWEHSEWKYIKATLLREADEPAVNGGKLKVKCFRRSDNNKVIHILRDCDIFSDEQKAADEVYSRNMIGKSRFSGGSRVTNLEWLNSLSDEKLIKQLNLLEYYEAGNDFTDALNDFFDYDLEKLNASEDVVKLWLKSDASEYKQPGIMVRDYLKKLKPLEFEFFLYDVGVCAAPCDFELYTHCPFPDRDGFKGNNECTGCFANFLELQTNQKKKCTSCKRELWEPHFENESNICKDCACVIEDEKSIEKNRRRSMEFFGTFHIETKKDIALDTAEEEIVTILEKQGYQVLGILGATEIIHLAENPIKNFSIAFKNHYKSIKNAW